MSLKTDAESDIKLTSEENGDDTLNNNNNKQRPSEDGIACWSNVFSAFRNVSENSSNVWPVVKQTLSDFAFFCYTLLQCTWELTRYFLVEQLIPELQSARPGSVGGFVLTIVAITVSLSVYVTVTGRNVCFYPARCYFAWVCGNTEISPVCQDRREGSSSSILEGSLWRMTRAPRCINS